MKKISNNNWRDIIYGILLFLFVIGIIMVFTIPIDKKTKVLNLKPDGSYNVLGFGDEYEIYRFASPNDNIVVYSFDDIYLVGEEAEKEGIAYGSTLKIANSQFVGLSSHYLLLITHDGLVAIAIDDEYDCSFEELPDSEMKAFIYPVSSEVKQNPK